MSMENLPKKEIVVISAAAVAAGIGITALRYIWKSKKEGKVVFVEGIDEEAATLYGVVSTEVDNEYLNKLEPERYDGPAINTTKEEQTE